MEFYKSKYSNIIIDAEKETTIQGWTSETEDMTADEFKKDMLVLADAYIKYKPKKVLVLQKDFRFIVGVELQTWAANNVGSKLEQARTEKMAFVISEDLFASVSVEQSIDEKADMKMPIKYFDEESEASKWLGI